MNKTNEEKILDILASMQSGMLDMHGDIKSMDDRLTKLEFRIETEIIPKMDALGEGHAAILEQLVPVSRVDELENRVKFLETMLRSVCEEMQTLKTAQ